MARRAAKGFERAWRHCLLRVPDGADLDCEGARELVPRFIEASTLAEDLPRQVLAYLVAQDPRWRIPASAPATAQIEEGLRSAAENGEQQGQNASRDNPAPAALVAASYARLALGEVEHAEQDRARLSRSHQQTHGTEIALVSVSIAKHHIDHQHYQRALLQLPAGSPPDDSTPLRLRVLWYGTRARALLGAGNPIPAEREAQRVVQWWEAETNPTSAVGGAAPAPMEGREAVVDAVGVARFVLAEARARSVTRLGPPRFAGPPTHEGAARFLDTQVRQWAEKKQQALLAVADELDKLRSIQPVPPVRWMVAGQTRLGELRADFADQLLSISLPEKLAANASERQAFERALSGSAQPVLAGAKQAFATCVDLSRDQPALATQQEYCKERKNALP